MGRNKFPQNLHRHSLDMMRVLQNSTYTNKGKKAGFDQVMHTQLIQKTLRITGKEASSKNLNFTVLSQ